MNIYRIYRLKTRLQKGCIQLVFIRPRVRSQSEFVFSEEMCLEDVMDSQHYDVKISSESEETGDNSGDGVHVAFKKR